MYTIRKMLCVVLSLALTMITVILSVSYYLLSKNEILTILSQSRQDNLRLISQKIDSFLSGAQTISNLLARDDTVLGMLMTNDLSLVNIPTVNGQIDQTIAKYYQAFSEMSLSYYVVCMGENGFLYSSLPGFSQTDYQKLRSYSWFQKNIAMNVPSYTTTHIIQSDEAGKKESCLAIVRNIFSGYNYVGSILTCVPERVLYNSYCDLLGNNHLYLLDALSVVISSSNVEELGTMPFKVQDYQFIRSENGYSIIKIDNESFFSTKYTSKATGWTIFEQRLLSEVMAPMKTLTICLILIGILACAVWILLSIAIAQRISSPIMKFCSTMQQAASKRFAPVKVDSHIWEIHALSNHFNAMSCEILGLMSEIKQKEKDISKAKYDFLRAQINPHFLYNTLLSIKCTVSMHKDKQASEMISLLISMLRNSISSYRSTTTLLDETQYLTQYIRLQNMRYDNAIAFHCRLDPQMADLCMIRFILQPILENAIMHSDIDDGRRMIELRFELNVDRLLIKIMNNGKAFTQAKLDDVLNRQGEEQSGEKSHIGLANIQNRIRLLYGMPYGLSISEEAGFDTTVCICLPKIEGEKQ